MILAVALRVYLCSRGDRVAAIFVPPTRFSVHSVKNIESPWPTGCSHTGLGDPVKPHGPQVAL